MNTATDEANTKLAALAVLVLTAEIPHSVSAKTPVISAPRLAEARMPENTSASITALTVRAYVDLHTKGMEDGPLAGFARHTGFAS